MPGPRSQLLVNQLVTGVEIASQRPLPRSSRPTTLRPGTSRRHAPCTDTETVRSDCRAWSSSDRSLGATRITGTGQGWVFWSTL